MRNLDLYKDHLERRARRLSLLEAIRLGLEQNPVLAEGYAQLQQSQWQAIAIRREAIPSLQLSNDDPGLLGWRRETDRDGSNDTVTGSSLTNQTRTSRFLLPKLQLQWTFFDPTRTPRVRAQQATTRASLAQPDSSFWSARAVLSASLPSFSLVGKSKWEQEAYGQQNVPTPSSTTTGTNSTFTNQAGLFFAWKPFDGGIDAALSTALKKRAEQSIQQAALDRLTVTSQVEASHAALISSLIVIDTAQDQLRSSGRALAAFRRQFAGGADNATTLIQMIQGYTKASESYRNSVSKHNSAIAELYRYSAQWPESALAVLQRRVQQLTRE